MSSKINEYSTVCPFLLVNSNEGAVPHQMLYVVQDVAYSHQLSTLKFLNTFIATIVSSTRNFEYCVNSIGLATTKLKTPSAVKATAPSAVAEP